MNKHPVVWLVLGDKLGDNAQVHAIAAALGWPTITKRLQFLPQYRLGKPSFRASLYHIDREQSDLLAPPWPDLILTVGRRPSMAALWVRKQSAGRTKVAIVGRPRRMLKEFALVVVPPQYRMPAAENVVFIDLPLMRVDEKALTAAAQTWETTFAALPRPLTAVLVGGPTKPFVFDEATMTRFIQLTEQTTGREGSLFFTTSRRTPEHLVNVLQARLPATAQLYRWQPDRQDNPYLGLLALADRFVVTGDSVSMVVEVARLGRPLAIFDLPVSQGPLARAKRELARRLQPEAGDRARSDALTWLGARLYDTGLVGFSRDFSALYERLVQRGVAVWLGDPFPATPPTVPDEVTVVAQRVQGLFQ